MLPVSKAQKPPKRDPKEDSQYNKFGFDDDDFDAGFKEESMDKAGDQALPDKAKEDDFGGDFDESLGDFEEESMEKGD